MMRNTISRLVHLTSCAAIGLLCLAIVFSAGCKRPPDSEEGKAAPKGSKIDDLVYTRPNGDLVRISNGNPITLSADFPTDVAIYPGATIAMVVMGENEPGATLNTPDSAEKVVAFYRKRLKDDGWRFNEAIEAPNYLVATKDGRSLLVDIRTESGKTSVCLTLPKKKDEPPKADVKPSPPPGPRDGGSWQDLYEAKTYTGAEGRKLPYRLLKPTAIEPGKQYPLVLFLHGLGERGDDNVKQLVHGAGDFAKAANRRKYPCFVVAPQCPGDKRWIRQTLKELKSPHFAMTEKPADPMILVLELLDKLAADLPVDKERIYVTGLSMGGFGTWDLVQRRPDFFAAAIPICGRGDSAQATKLKNLPIWAFHGEKDPVVPVQCTKTMIEAIRRAGGSPKMTLYPGVGHDSWTATYADPEVMAWLFAQKTPKQDRKTGHGK
jgi:dienelactone hydrolase